VTFSFPVSDFLSEETCMNMINPKNDKITQLKLHIRSADGSQE